MLLEQAELLADPKLAAEEGGLRYVADSEPGIARRRCGRLFSYVDASGKAVTDATTLDRIRKLAIPPAWTEVWISPDPNGHLAATGRDARGRKQYRYHPDFIGVRDAAKYEHVIAFARQLPQLRRQIARDMALKGLPREKVLATVVYLLECTQSRIGNDAYARANKSYGLTTLRNRHVRVRGDALKFRFLGKSGKTWQFDVESRRVANVIRACQDLPGQRLFEYRDETGAVHAIHSETVNSYLRAIAGRDITAKDFRTWSGTVEAASTLQQFVAEGAPPVKSHIKIALKRAAERLGNTVAICRKCYVHPDILACYERGEFRLTAPKPSRSRFALSPHEKAVLLFLEKRLRMS